MSIGASGRIVIEIEPDLKRQLYAVLTREGMTLKDWFLRESQAHIANANQFELDLSARKMGLIKVAKNRKKNG